MNVKEESTERFRHEFRLVDGVCKTIQHGFTKGSGEEGNVKMC